MLLEGRVALVTGASRGIGRAIAETFAAAGASVAMCARGEALDAVAEGIRARGGRASALRGDLRDEAFARTLIQHCRKEHGGLDVLVNNAGILKPARLGMVALDSVREHLETNFVPIVTLTQFAIRLMDPARSPSIINLASIAGTQGLDGLSAYSASKGAIVAFTRASARELASKGIRVNAIAPGFIDTEMSRDLSERDRARRIAAIALGRFGTAQEVAEIALFLASGCSSYVTGQVLGVDGGMQV